MNQVITVSQLNFYIKSLLDGNDALKQVFLTGEISNFTDHYRSGHFYFSLKDEKSVIKCVMFSRYSSRVRFHPEDGMKVLVRGGVSPLESTAGTVSPVRGITTRTTTGGAADTTWRELTTILIVDDVIPAVRSALRSRFSRTKNTAQSRSAIRSQVIVELEKKLSAQIIESYGEVTVTASADDPTVCLVEFSFGVAHGLNQIYLTVHITV